MKKNEMMLKMKEQDKKIKELEHDLKKSELELETNKIEERKNDMMRILKREIKDEMDKSKDENDKNIKLNNKKIDELETKIITIEEINKKYLLKIEILEKNNDEIIEENKKIINELKDVCGKIEKYKNYNDRIIELNKEITETEKKKNKIFEILNDKEVIVDKMDNIDEVKDLVINKVENIKEEIFIVEKAKEIKKVNKKNSETLMGDMDNDLSIYIYKNNMLSYIDEDVIKYGCCKNYISGETGKKKHNNFYIEEINDIFIMSMEGILMDKTTKDRSLIIRRVLNYIFKDEIIYISRYLTTAIIKNEILINKIKEIEETFKNVELINKILEERNINKINKVELKGKNVIRNT